MSGRRPQLGLFDVDLEAEARRRSLGAFGGHEPPAARSTDPETSHEAADRIAASGVRDDQCESVAWVVAGYPGSTSAELAEHAQGEGVHLDRYQVARRLPELERLGRVRRGEARVCRATGNRSLTWWCS